jgi:hypothetical protein
MEDRWGLSIGSAYGFSVCCARGGCGWLAGQKGRSVFWYTLFGYFFFIITLIVILILPSKQTA